MKILMRQLSAIIPIGAENAVSVRRLANLCGCSEREIRRSVELLRRDGVLICSSHNRDGGGYFKPRDSTEISAYFKRQLSRIGHIWAALSPFKQYLAELPIEGQTALDMMFENGGEQNG